MPDMVAPLSDLLQQGFEFVLIFVEITNTFGQFFGSHGVLIHKPAEIIFGVSYF